MSRQREDPSLSIALRKNYRDRVENKEQDQSIAARLTRRAREQKFTIPFPGEDGPIPVIVSMPTLNELNELVILREKILAPLPENHDEFAQRDKDVERFYHMLADVCVDESLDYEFFKSEALMLPDLFQIVTEILLENGTRVAQAKSFRQKTAR